MTKEKLKGAVAMVFAMSLLLVAWDGSAGKVVELEGHLYSARDFSGTPDMPVGGAVVSTSLNSVTAVTNEHGYFHLRTNKRISGDEYFTISVQSGRMTFRMRGMNAPMKGGDFVLSEPDRIRFIYPPYTRSQ
jgi:hypothetical protein